MPIELFLNADHSEVECDFGVFVNSGADPQRELHQLMLITEKAAAELLRDGPKLWRGGLSSVTEQDGHRFFHCDYAGRRWTWELHKGNWWDDKGPPIYVGRWPD